jgi:CMP-N-acetylneuraminic acid synthetase
LRSRTLTRTIVSTDDQEIADAARSFGVEVPFLRPGELSREDTPMAAVIQHALETLSGGPFDAVVLLQPTSPLRRTEDIDAAIALMERTGADTVVSVIEVPHQFVPSSLMKLEQDHLVPLEDGLQVLRRQDKPRLFARNGPAILIVKAELARRGVLYGADIRPFVMDRQHSVDIDDAMDVLIAEFFLQNLEKTR